MAITKKTGTKAKAKAKGTSTETKASANAKPVAAAGSAIVTMDCRHEKDRRGNDRRQKDAPVAVERRQIERRAKVNRRRQIDPTTCERDYSVEEVEFMSALDQYKRRSGRMFPTCSEILEVLRELGYERRPAPLTPSVATEMPSSQSPVEQAI